MQKCYKVPPQSMSIIYCSPSAVEKLKWVNLVFCLCQSHVDKITFSASPSLLTLIRVNLWTAAFWRKLSRDLTTMPGNILPFRINNASHFLIRCDKTFMTRCLFIFDAPSNNLKASKKMINETQPDHHQCGEVIMTIRGSFWFTYGVK